MRRILLTLCLVLSATACVNLGKPEKVAECAATNSCVNAPIDAAPVSPVDGGKADRAADGKRDTRNPGIDGPATNDDGPAIADDGPPVSDDGPLAGDDTPPVTQPDGPVIQPDVADDVPVVIGDDGPPAVTPDGPPDAPPVIVPDAKDAAAGDTRDGASDPPPPDTRDAYRDVAVGICAPGGVVQPAGTVCRAAVSVCDVDETCDGVTADCPADKLATAGKECRAAAGDCDVAETCSGTSASCPADGFKQVGTVCREAAGPCDYAESCTGTGAVCPTDTLKPSTSACHASTGVCDPAENCTGLSVSCPVDVLYSAPTAPATLGAQPGTLSASISWSAVTGATGYNIKRSTTSGGPYTTIATGVLTSPYSDTGLDSTKTYYYVVSAITTLTTCESGNSPEASVTPTGVCTKPAAPVVTAAAENGQIRLSWAAVSGATGYAVARSATSGTGYASIAQVTTTSYVDQDVVFGNSYYYQVTTKGACDSDPSTEVSASPLCAPAATAPTGLTASAPNTGGVVVLNWVAVPGAKTSDTYQIFRKASSGTTYAQIDEVTSPTVTYSDTTAVNGTNYDYVVTYFNGTCLSANSNVVTVTPACVMSKPVLTATAGDRKVDLSWTAPPNGSLTGYTVSRKTTGNYAVIANLTGAGTTTYTDTGLIAGTAYTYLVTAVGNCNADSDPTTATPFCTPPSVPGTLTATPGDAKVTLGWGASTPTPTSYTVQRKTGSGSYADLANPTVNSYSDENPPLANGTTYTYRVSASNGSCSSAYNAEKSATPQPTCAQGAPGKPTLTLTSSTQVKIDWTAASPVPTNGYNISRSSDGTTYASVADVANTLLTYTDGSNLTIGTTYSYIVTAKGTCSTPSSATSIALTCQNPAAPSPSIAAGADGKITVSWSTATGATAYTVSRGTASGGPYAAIAGATNTTATSYVDSGLTNATTYYYVVTASNANQQCLSAQSTQVSARSCIIPTTPTGVTATRTGNNRVTVGWTNSTNAQSYYIQRSGGTNVRVTQGSPYVDSGAANGTSYTYVLSAASDTGGLCSSGNSAPSPAVPSCTVIAGGTTSFTPNPQTRSEYCFVTCYDIQGINSSNEQGRTLSINGSLQSCPLNGNCSPPTLALPAKNGGYVFQIGACPSSGECYAWPANTWWGTSFGCP